MPGSRCFSVPSTTDRFAWLVLLSGTSSSTPTTRSSMPPWRTFRAPFSTSSRTSAGGDTSSYLTRLMKRARSRKNLWEGLPEPVKSALAPALRAVPPQYLLGGAFRRALGFLGAAQWWSAEQAREWQLAELRKICDLAFT